MEEARPELYISGGVDLIYAKENDGKVKVALNCVLGGQQFAKGVVYNPLEEMAYDRDRLRGIGDMNWALPYQEQLAKCLANSFKNTVREEAAKALTGKNIFEGDARPVRIAEKS